MVMKQVITKSIFQKIGFILLMSSIVLSAGITNVFGTEEDKDNDGIKTSEKMVTPGQDKTLGKYEKSDRVFKRVQINNIVTYFHRRKIGEAIVEKDFIRYQFDADTGELIETKKQWRKGLPDQVTPVITKEQANALVEGEVKSTRLYIISPESDVFTVKPTPKNPCWVVRSVDNGRTIYTIIDAITGDKLGYGVPPPYEGLSFYGPDYGPCPQPPDSGWEPFAEHAAYEFALMGYNTEVVGNASTAKIQSHIQSDSTVMFYELNHGGSRNFKNQCDSDITAPQVDTWINSYSTMPFTFLASCDGMCDQRDDTFSYEFRKNSNADTVAVGYCGMKSIQGCADDCWPYAKDWQDEMFTWMRLGYTVGYSFDRANSLLPDCAGANNCMRIAGDTNLKFTALSTSVPAKVKRSLCGQIYNAAPYYFSPLYAWTSNSYYRAHHIRCDSNVPSGQYLISSTSASYPYVEVVFMNDSKLTAYGLMNVDAADGEITFVSEQDRGKGIKITGGGLTVINGGQIKIYE
jgi:hypothetical protein